MKKLTAIVLMIIVLSTAMVGCGGKGSKPDPKKNSSSSSGISYKGKVFATQEELIAYTDKEYEEAYEATRIYKDHQIVGCWDYIDPQTDEPLVSDWKDTAKMSYEEYTDTGEIIHHLYFNEIDGWEESVNGRDKFSIKDDILTSSASSHKSKMSFSTDDKGRECMVFEYYEGDKLKTSKYIKYLGEKAPETKQ